MCVCVCVCVCVYVYLPATSSAWNEFLKMQNSFTYTPSDKTNYKQCS